MDIGRRKFIKVLFIGGTSFIVGKTLGPLFSKFFNNSSNDDLKDSPTAFKVIQDHTKLSIFDDTGEEIFQIDNGA